MNTLLLLVPIANPVLKFRGGLIRAIQAEGWRVFVGSVGATEETIQNLKMHGVGYKELPLSRTGLSPVYDFQYLLALRKFMRQIRPDVALSYSMKPNIYSALASPNYTRAVAIFNGLGYAFMQSEVGSEWRRFVSRCAIKVLLKLSTRRNHAVIFQNEDDRAELTSQNCLHESTRHFVVNGSGVDLGKFKLAPLPNRIRFLMVCRFLKSKGTYEYARAAMALKEKFPTISFALLGKPDEGPDAVPEADLRRWGAEGLEILSAVDDVRPILQTASVIVLPSYYREGTPRVLLEAMAMGRPIITTNSPGCRETVDDGRNGILVQPRRWEDLADSMKYFINNPAAIEHMGAVSSALAREKYDEATINQQIIRVLGIKHE